MKTPAKRRDLIGLTPDPPKQRTPGLTKTGNLARPKTGGRKAGTPNKVQMSEEIREDLLAVYRRLGGVSWLLKWARANETEWVKLGLSRLMPAPVREDPELAIQNNINVTDMSDFEVARRIAFALASGHEEQKRLLEAQGYTVEADTLTSFDALLPVKTSARPSPAMNPMEEPVYPPPQFTDAEIRDLAKIQQGYDLVRDTHEGTYGGSPEEQGRSRRRSLF